MVTPYTMHIVPENTGLYRVPQTDAAAKKASELLQEDLAKHHTFFNTSGYHNHIPHHILALYGTGADPAALQKGYDNNASYQRATLPVHDAVVTDLIQNWASARNYLGREEHYPDFLRFFQRDMDSRADGWKGTLAEYVFKGDSAADDMLARLFAGFLHPLIQLMYGMEWAQPAIVAEALAQAAVHGVDIKGFLVDSEAEANARQEDSEKEEVSIVELLEAVRADEKLRSAARMVDANKIRDGVLARARDEMVRIASRVRVRPEEVDEKTAEMFDACVYMAAAAAFHPPKYPKCDFFLMHHVNSAPIFLTINAQSWILPETKARLLEWKIRMDLIQYAARGAPPLSVDRIAEYQSRDGSLGKTPFEIVSRLHDCADDGHAIKLGRAALICHDLCKKYEDKSWTKIKGDELWSKVYHLIVDSVQTPGPRWVRSCGMDEAWEEIPDIQQATKL